MVRALIVLAFVLSITGVAHADSAKIGEARKAIDEVRYDDARRLLVEALAEGGNSPAAIRQIYELSASTAIVLGERDLGEQYYRRWLALEPAAKLPAGSSPKLQEVFVAAQAYMAAQPRFSVIVTRPSHGEVELQIESDPLAMAAGAQLAGTANVIAFGADHRARVPIAVEHAKVFVVDERKNQLVAFDPPPVTQSPDPQPGPTPAPVEPRDQPPFAKRWTTWAVPAGALLVAGAIVGIVAYNQQQDLDAKLERSGEHFFDDIDAQHRTVRRNATLAIALGAGALVLAIPATIFYSRAPSTLNLGPLGAGLGVNLKF